MVAAALPTALPAPRLRWATEPTDGSDVWVALLFDAVKGAPPTLPWTPESAAAVLPALAALAAAGTPCPAPGLPPVAERVAEDLAGWSRIVAGPPADLDPWERRRLERQGWCRRRSGGGDRPAAGIDRDVGAVMRRPASPGLPTVREFQRRFHDAALAWGRRRAESVGGQR